MAPSAATSATSTTPHSVPPPTTTTSQDHHHRDHQQQQQQHHHHHHHAPPAPPFPDPASRLRYLYGDVRRLAEISTPDIALHPADRDLHDPPLAPLRGVAAAQAHEEALVAATGGTLAMEVESVVVDRDGVFGCVIGVLRAGRRRRRSEEGEDRDDDDDDGDDDDDEEEEEEEDDRKKERRSPRGTIAMRFCGVWRFDGEGRAVEHWENAADPAAFVRWLNGSE